MICSSPEYKELKWIAGEFYWMESVQSYNEGGWDYKTELHKFVQGGMTGTSFIDAVSGIVNRGEFGQEFQCRASLITGTMN